MAEEIRLWLRMLTATTMIETELRRRLRASFNTTLPRFDLLAALDRAPQGLSMAEVSARMMVTGGNVTGLAARLEAEGLIARRPDPQDRRAVRLRLTPAGERAFAAQSAAHAGWVRELFSGLDGGERAALHRLLGRTKDALRGDTQEEAA